MLKSNMHKHRTQQSIHLPLMHQRSIVRSELNKRSISYLQQIPTRVDTIYSLCGKHRRICQKNKHSNWQPVPCRAKCIYQHVPVILLTGILQLPTARDEQHPVLFSVSQLLLSYWRVEAVPGSGVLGRRGRTVAVLEVALGVRLRRVVYAVDVHYNWF
jgi:hypothetical protein